MRNLLHIKKHRGHSASVLFTLKNCFYDKPNNNQPKNNNWHGITPLFGFAVFPNVLRIGSAPLPNRTWNTFTKSGIMSKLSRYPSTGIKSGTMSIGESAYATVSAANSFAYQGVSFFSWQETLPVHLFSFFLIFLSLCRRLFCYYI